MNKKLLFLLVGMIVCLSVIGGALAVNYFDANQKDFVVTADSAVIFDLGSTTAVNMEVDSGASSFYTVKARVTKSANQFDDDAVNGVLTIKLTGNENLSIELLDASGNALANSAGIAVNGVITIEGVNENVDYLLKVSLASGLAADVEINGSISITLDQKKAA